MTGCASTELVSQWTDTGYTGPTFQNILVVGMTDKPAERRLFEEEFVRKLQERPGVTAIPSARLIPAENELKREQIEAAISGSDIDAVLVTRLLKVDKQTRYVPGSPNYYPGGYYSGFYDYYYTSYDMVRTPGYITEDTIVSLETNLYQAATSTLVWSASSQTFNPGSVPELTDDLAGVVIKDLTKAGLLP